MRDQTSDDYERYSKMGLRLDPNHARINFRIEKKRTFNHHNLRIHKHFVYIDIIFSVKIVFINQSYGSWLFNKQSGLYVNEMDYSFLEFIRRAVEYETDEEKKLGYLHYLRRHEAIRDFFTGSIKQLNPLIQFDPEPNQGLKDTKVELYKISISFPSRGKTCFKL